MTKTKVGLKPDSHEYKESIMIMMFMLVNLLQRTMRLRVLPMRPRTPTTDERTPMIQNLVTKYNYYNDD